MSTPRIEDTLLQRLLDNDLGADEHSEVQAILEASSADQRSWRELERLGQLVTDVTHEDGNLLSEAESSRMFGAVLAGLESARAAAAPEQPPTAVGATDGADAGEGRKRPNLRLIEGEGLGTLPPRSEKVAFEPKLGPNTAARAAADASAAQAAAAQDNGPRWPGLIAVVALAAAAVLALLLRPDADPRPPVVAEAVAPVIRPAADPVIIDEEPEVIVASHLGTEVELIDFGSNMGTVFQVPGERDVPVAVVWISDEEYVR